MKTIQIDDEIARLAHDLGVLRGEGVEAVMREVILQMIEDAEDRVIAEERLARLKRGETGTVSLEDVMADPDVDG